MRSRRVTINDVAAAAGVSRQTVTRAMNAMAEITPETRERVLRISEELGYRPSRFASNMARQTHHAVGLVVSTLRNPYYTDLAADLLKVSAARGWQTTMATAEGASDVELVTRLSAQVDAIIGYFTAPEEDLVRAARGLPVVLIERSAAVKGAHSIMLDFRAGMRDLVSQLRERGSRTFAMIDSAADDSAVLGSARRHALEEFTGPAPMLVVTAPETQLGAASAFAEIRDRRPDADTVIVFNDLMAMGAMQSAHALGLSIPDDVKIVGIDGLSLGEAMFPPLTTLAIDRHAVASAAAEIVAQCLSDDQAATISRVVVPRPVWRGSA